MTDISLIPILKSEGATIGRANNSYNYGKSEIERLEKEKCELLGIIQGKDKVIAELKMKLLTLENKEQIVTTTISN